MTDEGGCPGRPPARFLARRRPRDRQSRRAQDHQHRGGDGRVDDQRDAQRQRNGSWDRTGRVAYLLAQRGDPRVPGEGEEQQSGRAQDAPSGRVPTRPDSPRTEVTPMERTPWSVPGVMEAGYWILVPLDLEGVAWDNVVTRRSSGAATRSRSPGSHCSAGLLRHHVVGVVLDVAPCRTELRPHGHRRLHRRGKQLRARHRRGRRHVGRDPRPGPRRRRADLRNGVPRVSQLDRTVGVAALQVAVLVSDVQEDVVALILQVGADA